MTPVDDKQTQRPTVLHLPDWQVGNPYQALLAAGIRQAGWQVEFADFPKTRFPLWQLSRSRQDIQALHIHWINPYIQHLFWSSSKPRFLIKVFLLALDVLLTRMSGKRVIWTVHNRLSHETPDAKRELLARRLLARCVNSLIFHSEGAREEFAQLLGHSLLHKSQVIPHGHYLGVYPEDSTLARQLHERFGLDEEQTVILFFGAVRRYKGVLRLIEAFSQAKAPRQRLIIAGKPLDDDIRQAVVAAAIEDPRISLHLAMVPDNEVAPLFSLADAVAIPFEPTLTSGSVLLAMSMGKPMILPRSARMLGVADDTGALFYENDDQLARTLGELSGHDLAAMGSANLRKAERLDWSTIGRQTAALYS